jgi:hypothetical protein
MKFFHPEDLLPLRCEIHLNDRALFFDKIKPISTPSLLFGLVIKFHGTFKSFHVSESHPQKKIFSAT